MGLKIIVPGADFSNLGLGTAGLYTSLSADLLALFETNTNAARAKLNAAPGSNLGAIVGNPTFTSEHMVINNGQFLNTGIKPGNGGFSLAIAVELRNGGGASDEVLNCWNSGTTNEGLLLLRHVNRRLSALAYAYASATPPYSSPTTVNAFRDRASDGFEFLVVTAEDTVGMTMYMPAAGTKHFVSASGYFAFDNGKLPTVALPRSTTTNQKIGMFGFWNRVLTEDQVNTLYAEMRDQLPVPI